MEIVRAKYKTGRYIGKLIEMKEEENRALFQVLAVETHPQQGDLHQPKQIDVPLFHQRKALAYLEKTWVPSSTVKPYNGDLPDYKQSLELALNAAKDKVRNDHSQWGQASLQLLDELEHEYRL
ncbi:kinase-associated protein B [Alkalihalobacillus xiaoxiensis]|uniref:Kinase-associated protein B n=1 Tax=Shouchella xiaoxiensis TaxID=766895 RepID=A0ABS2SXG9_9BACI|nr:kinase-associated protein B [Shouchella xiaoxiensis]